MTGQGMVDSRIFKTTAHGGVLHHVCGHDVRITIAERSPVTCVLPVQRSAQPRLDNCYRDQAVTNARQPADLLSSAVASVVAPGA